MKNVSSNLQTSQLVSVLKGVLLIVFGVWLLKSPIESLYKLNFLFGLVILLSGFLELWLFFRYQRKSGAGVGSVIGGVIDVFLGLFLMTNPKFILMVITILVSIWLVFRGVMSIRKAIDMREQNVPKWGWTLGFGILFILLAVLFVWHPQVIGITIAFWSAIAFISLGILRILFVFSLQKAKNSTNISDAEIIE